MINSNSNANANLNNKQNWLHAPSRQLIEHGTYMVTCGTYKKEHLFKSPEALDFLQAELFKAAKQFGWRLQAWAIFSNHYHFIAQNESGGDFLKDMMQVFHSITARALNQLDGVTGRKVWCNYWDSKLTFHKSYLARINYVINNPVKHGLVRDPKQYPWCSARWFYENGESNFCNTVKRFKTDQVNVLDDF